MRKWRGACRVLIFSRGFMNGDFVLTKIKSLFGIAVAVVVVV
jgi:hypothetical protein